MLLFLYLGGTISILYACLSSYRAIRKAKKKKLGQKEGFSFFVRKLIGTALTSSVLLIGIMLILPSILWNVCSKEFGISEKITNRQSIYFIGSKEKKCYLEEISENDESFYAFNIHSDKADTSDRVRKNNTQIKYINKLDTPRVESIARYKVKKLPETNFLFNAVNEMYANVYTNTTGATFVDTVNVIYIPKSSTIGQP